MLNYTKEIEINLDTGTGYLYFIDEKHPLATGNSNRVYFHRHIMSMYLDRWITSEEHVHHKDEDKLNNSISNLQLLNKEEHAKLHNPGNKVKFKCAVCGTLVEVSVNSVNKRLTCSISCRNIAKSKWIIEKEELESLIWHYTARKIAEKYGVSDKGVIKKAISLNCKLPPPYFHNKSQKFKQEQILLNNIRPAPSTVF